MTGRGGADWDPGGYARFRGLRLRPAPDPLARVGGAGAEAGRGGAGGAAEVLRVLDAALAGA